MDDVKPWYLSRTIWASAIVVIATLAGLFGFVIEDADIDLLVDALLQAVVALAALVAIVGRIFARARIG